MNNKKQFTAQDMIDFVRYYDNKFEYQCFDTFEQELDEWMRTKQKLNIHGVMQAEASASAQGAAVASEGREEANMCAGRAVCPKCGKNFYAVTKLWNHLDRCRG